MNQVTETIFAYSYFFIGCGCEHIYFIQGERGIINFQGKECENIQEGHWLEVEKNADTRLNACGPLNWWLWLCVPEQTLKAGCGQFHSINLRSRRFVGFEHSHFTSSYARLVGRFRVPHKGWIGCIYHMPSVSTHGNWLTFPLN